MSQALVVFLATASILRAIPASALEISEAQVLYWSAQVNTRDFGDLLAEVQRGPKEEWPAVVSAEYAAPLPPEAKRKHASFRSIATELARKLEAYHKTLPAASDQEFATRAAGLLALRDHIARQPSYVNLVLIDALNRVLIVNVAKHLVRVELVPEIAALVEPLAAFRLDLPMFATIAEAELGSPLLDDAQRASTDQLVIFNALWAKLAPETVFPYTKALEKSRINQLLTSRGLVPLLARQVGSDGYLHGGLPRTLQYLRKAAPFSDPAEFRKLAHEDFRKILDAMKGVPTEPTLNERIGRYETGFHAVTGLLGEVTDGSIDELPMF